MTAVDDSSCDCSCDCLQFKQAEQKNNYIMEWKQNELTSAKSRVLTLLQQYSPAHRQQLLLAIHQQRQTRRQTVLRLLEQQEQALSLKAPNQKKAIGRPVAYQPSKAISSAAAQTLSQQCLHYLLFSPHPDATCSICVRELEEGDKASELPCSHWFHTECIESWFGNRTICPNCREVPSKRPDPLKQQLASLAAQKTAITRRDNLLRQRIQLVMQQAPFVPPEDKQQ